MIKKRICLLLVTMLLATSSVCISYADDSNSISTSDDMINSDVVTNIDVNLENLELSESEESSIKTDNLDLARKIAIAEESDISSIIQEECKDDILLEKLVDIAKEEKEESGKTACISLSGNGIVETYETDKRIVEVGPLYVAVEEKNATEVNEDDQISTLATTSTKTGTAKRIYYAKPWGYKMLTVCVTLKFSYNGTKASYHSNFDAYYKRHLGAALYSVTNWKEGKEAAGTSYQGYCRGNFSEGITIKGTGVTWIEYYIKHNIKCSKTGNLTSSYICE